MAVLLDNRLLTAYVTSIAKRLGFTAQAVDTSMVDTANLPGGFIFVNRGLLDFLETESQLAGALAHEVGHIAGHGLRELYEKVKQAALAEDKTMGQNRRSAGRSAGDDAAAAIYARR